MFRILLLLYRPCCTISEFFCSVLAGYLLLNDLRTYYKIWKPDLYLFEGIKGGKYSPQSVLQIIKKAAIKANIGKRVTPHMLRQSFATHLLENGTDIRYIQVLLGHNSTRTTEIYTQVAVNNIREIKSPIDDIPESRT